jgi:hypothetical protein
MDILRDNDMHPQYVLFSDFRRLRNLYVELGVLYFKCKIAFCLSSCCTTDTSVKREICFDLSSVSVDASMLCLCYVIAFTKVG